MNIIDISWPIFPEMTQYKDKKELFFERRCKEPYALEHLVTLGTHTGTHIDAPLHFLPDGASIDQIPLSTFIGPCRIIDLSHITEKIEAHDVEHIHPKFGERILIKTKNSARSYNDQFDYNFIYVAADAAEYLAHAGIALIGFDYLGIERNQPAHQTHLAFASAGIPILEGLRLAAVTPGTYMLYAPPLLLQGLDAAWTRAMVCVSI